MEAFNFYGKLQEYCKEHKIFLALGEQEYANYISDAKCYEAYDMIMCADLRLTPVFNESSVQDVTYTGTIALGRKREENTQSTLDELFHQKYERRLKDLTEILVSMLEEFMCSEGIDVRRCEISYRINVYDVNIDFVSANVSINIPNE